MIEIHTELVKQLIQDQFPQYAHLPVYPVAKSGNDNRTFHLGDQMTVRLPSGKDYAPQVEKESTWLPHLAKHLSLPISAPIEKGKPTKDFPYEWSINKWIDGDTVSYETVEDLTDFASSLALFLKELQAIDATGGPLAGKHNFHRGGDLAIYHAETQIALEKLADVFPAPELSKLWDVAMDSKWEQAPVWVHGDVAVGNILVKQGKLCGVIDFGILGVGDPACDYVMAWTFFEKNSRKVFFDTLHCDDNTRNRAMGWALWKALIVYDKQNPTPEVSQWAAYTINEILKDYNSI
ncbi:aminoglycoside phosphotransferase APH(3') [Bacillus massiliigorillae]|uniref:aminoglycoside phosphotransferase APH(3') n=1 Tax=Bacillus massiliigorillae TaxID=1243664 RepID=UPI0003AAC225|nr:aminoglycoside phosphotransferase APH(3') [Bacillus massiliigorillae]